jgi:putative ABC transport system permease protein
MFRNYVIASINNLLKNKLFSLINITGLSIGLAACILIALFVQDETSYDKHWDGQDRMYRIVSTFDRTGGDPVQLSSVSELMQPALLDYFPGEIEAATRLESLNREILVNDNRFDLTVTEVDAGFVDVFNLEVLAGDLAATLSQPGTIALSDAEAARLFALQSGDSPDAVINETLTVLAVANGEEIRVDFRVGAVYAQLAENTVFAPNMTGLIQDVVSNCGRVWLSFCSITMIKLAPGTDAANINARFEDFTNTYVDISFLGAGPDVQPSDRVGFELQPIADIYLNSPFENNNRGNKTMVLAFSAIAVLVLLIGCINFTILSTAKASQRAREVAMRKTVGANRLQLAAQFLGETLLVVLPAVVLSVVLVEVLLPVFESLVGKSLAVDYSAPTTWGSLIFLPLLVTLVGGLYPALVLSRFRPAQTLKANRSTDAPGTVSLRNTLVVFQFAVSIALMAATAVIYLQVQYTMNRDPGFDRDNLLFIDGLQGLTPAEQNALKQQVGVLAGVETASLNGFRYMQRNGAAGIGARVEIPGQENEPYQFVETLVDHDFFRAYRFPFLAGRDFDQARDRVSPLHIQFEGDSSESSAIINATAARNLGFTNPGAAVGTRISVGGFNPATHYFDIIGVVADTQYRNVRETPRPEVYLISAQQGYLTGALTVRYQGNTEDMLERIGIIWTNVIGDAPMNTSFVDQNLANEFARENTEASMLVSFSLLAIVIACLGLFGSATFNVERRTKEIGIRKVMGAEVREIVTLLMWQFTRPVMFANVIAWPVAIWAMLNWLQRFSYQIDTWVLLPLCAIAGLIALVIAWLTVAGNTVKVATTNPVYALRYE